jgi:hypothetical protein
MRTKSTLFRLGGNEVAGSGSNIQSSSEWVNFQRVQLRVLLGFGIAGSY